MNNKYKRDYLFVVLTLFLLSTNVFAIKDKLLFPDKFGTGAEIVDIGINNGKANTNTTPIKKELLEIPALKELIDNSYDIKERDLDIESCSVDRSGISLCPKDKQICNFSYYYKRGTSTLHEEKTILHIENNPAIDYMYGYNTKPATNYGISDLAAYNIPIAVGLTKKFYAEEDGDYTFSFIANEGGHVLLDNQKILSYSNKPISVPQTKTITNDNHTNVNITIYVTVIPGISTITKTLTKGEHTLELNSFHSDLLKETPVDSGGMALTISHNGKIIWDTRKGQSLLDSTCNNGNGFITKEGCNTSYKYYTYTCEGQDDNGNDYVGPIKSSGGDCKAINLDSNGYCNDSLPPIENCYALGAECPIAGGGDCSRTFYGQIDNLTKENIFKEGGLEYVYGTGEAQYDTKTIHSQKLCPKQEIISCSDLGSGWFNLDKENCKKYLVKDSNPKDIIGDFKVTKDIETLDNVNTPMNISSTYTGGDINSLSLSLISNWKVSNEDNRFAIKMTNINLSLAECGGFSVYPKPSEIKVINNKGAFINNVGYTNPNGSCSSNNIDKKYLIKTNKLSNATILAIYDTKPTTDLSFSCKGECLVSNPNNVVELSKENSCSNQPGYIYDIEEGICYKAEEHSTVDFKKNIYIKSKINTGYNSSRDLCEEDTEYVCDKAGFTFNKDLQECVADYICNGYWNSSTGECEIAPNTICPNGYSYSIENMRCEGEVSCNSGSFNALEFKCESEPHCMGSDWAIDSTTNLCTKSIPVSDPICQENFQSWSKGSKSCSGVINFSNWSEKGNGNWSISGSSVTQEVNTPLPSTILSDSFYPTSSFEGTLQVGDSSNSDIDSDSVGVIFAYQDPKHYYLLNWSGSESSNSGGDGKISLEYINGETPLPHGGTRGTTIASNDSYGYWQKGVSYNVGVWISESEIQVKIKKSNETEWTDIIDKVINPNVNLNYGKVGFFTQSQEDATFSNFTLSTIPSCSGTGYVYSPDQDTCYLPINNYNVSEDIDKLEYTETPLCNGTDRYNEEFHKCFSEPSCSNGGSLDYERDICFQEESISCPTTSYDKVNGIDFSACNMSNICPSGGYTFDSSNPSLFCKMDMPCSNIDPSNNVCYENENASCSVGSLIYSDKFSDLGFNTACADTNICTYGNPTYMNYNGKVDWYCVASPSGLDYLCPERTFGWLDENVERSKCYEKGPKYDIKWEETGGIYDSDYSPYACTNVVVDNVPQDYHISTENTYSSLNRGLGLNNSLYPLYDKWTLDNVNKTCSKEINVYRCPSNPTAKDDQSTYFQEIVDKGRYTGEKGDLTDTVDNILYTDKACTAPINYAKNIWTEKEGDSTVASPAGTNGSHVTCSITTKGKETVTCNKYACKTLKKDKKTCKESYVKDSKDTKKDTESKCETNQLTYTYTKSVETCTNNAGTSTGQSTLKKGLGDLTGYSPNNNTPSNTCTQSFGPDSTKSYTSAQIIPAAPDTHCTLYDRDNFYWVESCPAGYVFNTHQNGSVTPMTNAVVMENDIESQSESTYVGYANRTQTSTENFNDRRCYKENSNADGEIWSEDKYYTNDFITVKKNYTIDAKPQCPNGLGWSESLEKCIGIPNECNGIFESSTGACLQVPIKPICDTENGYTYSPDRYRCEKEFQCPGTGSPNPASKKCTARITDDCVKTHIDGYDKVCSSNKVCPDDTVRKYSNILHGYYCKAEKSLKCPKDYVVDPLDNSKCVAPPKCAKGWVEGDTDCSLKYNWAEYSCPNTWEGPLETGNDCNGECGFNECWCNGKNPPANNCKKSTTFNDKGYDPIYEFEAFEKRPMRIHNITGSKLSEEDFGQLRNFSCGDNCEFSVNDIEGKGDQLCFSKQNGESSCFSVEGCFFEGSLHAEASNPLDTIKSLSLVDPHTLRSDFEKPVNVFGSCDYGYTLDTNIGKCVQAIISSCRMNGHVGWSGREEGISAIGVGGSKQKYSILEATGTGNFNISPLDSKDTTEWEGFNIGLMAIQLSDNNWYVSEYFLNSKGENIKRDMPPFIRKLPNKNYIFDDSVPESDSTTNSINNDSLKCIYKGEDIINACTKSAVKILMPEPELYIKSVLDIESLSNDMELEDPEDEKSDMVYITHNNNINISIKNRDKLYDLKSSSSSDIDKKGRVIDIIKFPSLNTQNDDMLNSEKDAIKDRLYFWDSFIDGDIGFLEFVREVDNSDSAEGYVPEKPEPFSMSNLGFSSIDYIDSANTTFFVKPSYTSEADCINYSKLLNDSEILNSNFTIDTNSKLKSLGSREPNSCTLIIKNSLKSFSSIDWAVKKSSYISTWRYMCSPYICNEKNECGVASCPTKEVTDINGNTETYIYKGNILPASLEKDASFCNSQDCDMNEDYNENCGRVVTCNTEDKDIFSGSNNECYRYKCNEGILDLDKKTCKVMKCPDNLSENSEGYCE